VKLNIKAISQKILRGPTRIWTLVEQSKRPRIQAVHGDDADAASKASSDWNHDERHSRASDVHTGIYPENWSALAAKDSMTKCRPAILYIWAHMKSDIENKPILLPDDLFEKIVELSAKYGESRRDLIVAAVDHFTRIPEEQRRAIIRGTAIRRRWAETTRQRGYAWLRFMFNV
jgi:hypothetical protein